MKSENLIKEAKNSDVLVHELFINLEMDKNRMTPETIKNIEKYHTNTKDVGDIANKTKTKNLVLTHFVPPNLFLRSRRSRLERTYYGFANKF